ASGGQAHMCRNHYNADQARGSCNLTSCRLIAHLGCTATRFEISELKGMRETCAVGWMLVEAPCSGQNTRDSEMRTRHLTGLMALKWGSRPLPEFIVILNAINAINERQRRISFTTGVGLTSGSSTGQNPSQGQFSESSDLWEQHCGEQDRAAWGKISWR